MRGISRMTGEFPSQRSSNAEKFPFDDIIIWAMFLETKVLYLIVVRYHYPSGLQYIPRNMHTVFALLCFVVVIYWLIFPHPSGLLHWHCGNLTIAPVPAKQPWWIWINTSCEFILNDYITTTKQSTTKPCAYFLGYIVLPWHWSNCPIASAPVNLKYRKISNIRRTKSQNVNVYRLGLQLSLCNISKPYVKWRMKM